MSPHAALHCGLLSWLPGAMDCDVHVIRAIFDESGSALSYMTQATSD